MSGIQSKRTPEEWNRLRQLERRLIKAERVEGLLRGEVQRRRELVASLHQEAQENELQIEDLFDPSCDPWGYDFGDDYIFEARVFLQAMEVAHEKAVKDVAAASSSVSAAKPVRPMVLGD